MYVYLSAYVCVYGGAACHFGHIHTCSLHVSIRPISLHTVTGLECRDNNSTPSCHSLYPSGPDKNMSSLVSQIEK